MNEKLEVLKRIIKNHIIINLETNDYGKLDAYKQVLIWIESIEIGKIKEKVIMEYQDYIEKFGSVDYNGVEIAITQAPYIMDERFYTSNGIDDCDNDYRILWPIVDMDCIDESEACDWTNYKINRID